MLVILVLALAISLLAAGQLIQRNALTFDGPTVARTWNPSNDCLRKIEALILAFEATSDVYIDYDFGLVEAASSAVQEGCNGTSIGLAEEQLLERVQLALDGARFRAGEPSWLLLKTDGATGPKGVFPAGVFGHIYTLLYEFEPSSEGLGVTHFIRCDYSLKLEPFRSFWAADLHDGSASAQLLERMEECGVRTEFEATIASRLSG